METGKGKFGMDVKFVSRHMPAETFGLRLIA